MLIDSFNRRFKYLRLSLTEKCNFKCSYCLPNGFQGCRTNAYLSPQEIENLALGFVQLGIEKIRLTGGEPTLRADLPEVISTLKFKVKLKNVALTTNGFRLDKMLPVLKASGLDSLNVSLDSLDPGLFKAICGFQHCNSIKNSIDAAVHLGFHSVKLNAVLLKGLNDKEFPKFMEFVKDRPVAVRFIELMRTADNHQYFIRHHMPVNELQKTLLENGWRPTVRSEVAGPAIEYECSGYAGKIGFISPYSKDFCTLCNRLRVSSLGGLRMCLFGQGDYPLRNFLQSLNQQNDLMDAVISALRLKPESHRLHEAFSGDMSSLSAIGG